MADTPHSTSSSIANIFVTGDFLIDHHIYQGQRHHFGDQTSPGVCVKKELGGAALIHRLLLELSATTDCGWKSTLGIDESAALQQMQDCDSSDPQCQTQPFAAYAFWQPHLTKTGEKKKQCWRVSDSMGFGAGSPVAEQWPWTPTENADEGSQVLVISDGGMGFRSRMASPHWGIPINDKKLLNVLEVEEEATPSPPNLPKWIVLKMSAPAGNGDLWRELIKHHRERLIVVVSVSELRRSGVRIGGGISWERILEDFHEALQHNPAMESLKNSRHLLVTFGSEGALWLNNDPSQNHPTATFVFDPEHSEGEHQHTVNGEVYGFLSAFTATIAAAVATDPEDPELSDAMRKGLAAMQILRKNGHGPATSNGAGFPAKNIASELASTEAASTLQKCVFECDESTCPIKPDWSLLALHEGPAKDKNRPLFGIARRALIHGPKTLLAPTLRVGDFFTADRSEIEALRSLRILVRRYLSNHKADKPLSIGVFGPPGSGKSFAVKELAKDLLGDDLGWLEFNLSQFNGAADLIGALHQVRDTILNGKTPVAFFDEFDSQNLDWLKYLLAPMQDGAFQEGQLSHPIGQCLFIFAGGTSATFEEFEAKGELNEESDDGKEAAQHFILSKGPDFASRLDGKLNVIGPNPRKIKEDIIDPKDIFYPVRRALFIRSYLDCDKNEPDEEEYNERLKIHPGLATALLEIEEFTHGSRSLCKLLDPFKDIRRHEEESELRLSDLSSSDQLKLHINLPVFNDLSNRDAQATERLGVTRLASAIHEYFRGLGQGKSWFKKEQDCDLDGLSEFLQASNFAAARRIPANLRLAGLHLAEGHATNEELEVAVEYIKFNLELLAEAEHDGWMQWHFDNGWSCADLRDDAKQQHNLLRLYSDLSEEEKNKDRESIENYPKIVNLADLKIVPIG